jgi:hypothetical protein
MPLTVEPWGVSPLPGMLNSNLLLSAHADYMLTAQMHGHREQH